MRKVYKLASTTFGMPFNIHVLVEDDISMDYMVSEWSYAVRYGADGLDLPNYDRALEIVRERNPNWEMVEYEGNVRYDTKNIRPK